MKQKVLFICVDNSARSQIAAAKQSAPLHARARARHPTKPIDAMLTVSTSEMAAWCR